MKKKGSPFFLSAEDCSVNEHACADWHKQQKHQSRESGPLRSFKIFVSAFVD